MCPDLALIRFIVQDEDVFGDPYFLGQATYPVQCLRSGKIMILHYATISVFSQSGGGGDPGGITPG